jgi:hypothetical protein
MQILRNVLQRNLTATAKPALGQTASSSFVAAAAELDSIADVDEASQRVSAGSTPERPITNSLL